jgi:putative transport protein
LFNLLTAEQMLVVFAILALGAWIGQLSIRGVSLGAAGVLFVALVFGHYGFSVPQEVMELGLLLFVYAIGLQAGPRFFRTFRRHGIRYIVIALVTMLASMLATIGIALYWRLPYTLATGMYSGALTCTPCLAAAIDVIERVDPGATSTASVGYGVAYPFGMLSIVLLIQFLPRMLGRNLRQEEERWLEEKKVEEPALKARQFLITNPNINGRRVAEINPHRMTMANISRVKRDARVFAATPEIVLKQGDVVMVVGVEDELEKMRLLLGDESHERMDANTNVISVDVEVTEGSLAGKTLGEMRVWERYNVVITRIRRQGFEITPTGSVDLEIGDNIRVVGERAAVEAFSTLVTGTPHRAAETNMLPFLIGLLLGLVLGAIPLTLPNGLQIRLGSAGGAFLVSLLVGHFGGIGPLRLHVPAAARNLSRELGLMLFLAGAGANAGARFLEILQQQGLSLLLAGALITILSTVAGLAVMHLVFRMNLLSTMGALCACMTNPPGLGAANAQTDTDLPTITYATVYPVALIFKIVLAQVLVEILR